MRSTRLGFLLGDSPHRSLTLQHKINRLPDTTLLYDFSVNPTPHTIDFIPSTPIMPAIDELGSSKAQPLPLLTHITIGAKQGIWIQCDSAVRLRAKAAEYNSTLDIIIESDGALYLAMPESVSAIPIGPIHFDFAHGWLKLPAEIKVQILSYNLDMSRAGGLDIDHGEDEIMHHARTTPEIASLAQEVYFSRNTFVLRARDRPYEGRPALPSKMTPSSLPSSYMAYPSPAVGHHVRTIIYELYIDTRSWERLQRLGAGDPSFPNLATLIVYVDSNLWGVHAWHTLPFNQDRQATYDWIDGIMPGHIDFFTQKRLGVEFRGAKKLMLELSGLPEVKPLWDVKCKLASKLRIGGRPLSALPGFDDETTAGSSQDTVADDDVYAEHDQMTGDANTNNDGVVEEAQHSEESMDATGSDEVVAGASNAEECAVESGEELSVEEHQGEGGQDADSPARSDKEGGGR